MSNKITQKDLRSTEYVGFLSDRFGPASRRQAQSDRVPLPKVRTIALNRGDSPKLIKGNRKIIQ